MSKRDRVAVIQDSPSPFDPVATAEKAAGLIAEAARGGAKLAVFPEAFLGGYPKGLNFDAPVGRRLDEGRADFLRYHKAAVALDGLEVAVIAEAARAHDVFTVMGVIERDGGTLYCTALYIDPVRGLVGKHRKLMPTGSERLVWGFGDGSTISTVDSSVGRVGAVICWENYMPMLRMAMYDQGVEIYCAPTADDRDSWVATMRHIALEGRCYVLSSCQTIALEEFGDGYRSVLHSEPGEIVMRGGSMIVDPLGEIIAGPVHDEKTILFADIDRDRIRAAKFDFDAVGHYARPDVFSLSVDTAAKAAVGAGVDGA